MRHALTLALQNYEGAILVVSHDRYLLSNTVDQFWLVHDGGLSEFDGDLEDYHQFIKRSMQEEDPSSERVVTENSAEAKKEKKRREAEIRKLMSPLKKTVDKLEAQVEKIQSSLEAIEEKLADTELYEAKNKDNLQTILAKQASQTQQLQEVEESWMEKLEELEEMTEQLNNN
jgi:ATP-binding cassette subfamily F protein 3